MRDELLDIQGVGEATAEKIEAVYAAHGGDREDLREALDYLEAGRPGYAEKFIRRSLE